MPSLEAEIVTRQLVEALVGARVEVSIVEMHSRHEGMIDALIDQTTNATLVSTTVEGDDGLKAGMEED